MGKIFDLNFYLDEVQRLCAEGMDVVEAIEKVKKLKEEMEGGEELEEEWNVEKTHKSYSFLQRKCRTWE